MSDFALDTLDRYRQLGICSPVFMGGVYSVYSVYSFY